jgi:hypothetical protein
MNHELWDVSAELAQLNEIQAESIGWLPLGEGAYLHISEQNVQNVQEVLVVGIAQQGDAVLLIS